MSKITAILGPTNTGKTHHAIERMLGYKNGAMGLPLRLLAKEIYDRIVEIRGANVVALVTGEERIVPPKPQYWICTVETMPEDLGFEFIAVDEIQMCGDPERGHIFTDRLLHMRGKYETLFLGASTMRSVIADLVPEVHFNERPRLSQLTYDGSRKISRLKPRSAVVGFSIEGVYATAELLRRLKGGAAVVMGALSPRTRNAQVELYQNGDVDYIVATDAIGMGLNLDLNHVAFSSLSKFDGRRMRNLAPNELAQIAGRAGRGMNAGTFGVTGDAPKIEDTVAQAIMDHRFAPLRQINWRSRQLNFATPDTLIASLEVPPDHDRLVKAREAEDLRTLRHVSEDDSIRLRAQNPKEVQLLWNVCRLPDFRSISPIEHAQLVSEIFVYLRDDGYISDDWIAKQIRAIDKPHGDIDLLSKRLSFVRTWTYVAQRKGWVKDENHWRGVAQEVENRLSDALHAGLTQRFVDRRTSVLLKRLNQKEALLAKVEENGEVTVEGEFVGRLEGFTFRADQSAAGKEAQTIKTASLQALAPYFHLRADKFYNAPDTEIDFTDQGGLMWGEHAVGKLVASEDPYKPRVVAFVDDLAGPEIIEKVTRRLQHFIDRKINTHFEALFNLQKDEELTPLARGFAFRLYENFGILRRAEVAKDVKELDQDARSGLRKHGIKFGQFTIFLYAVLKPAPTRLRLLLWSLAQGFDEAVIPPPAGFVTTEAWQNAPDQADLMSGFRNAGDRAIRVDMLERLADLIRAQDTRGGFEASSDMLSISGTSHPQFAALMKGLGYHVEEGTRPKVKKALVPAAEEVQEPVSLEPSTQTETDQVGPEEPKINQTDEPEAPVEPPEEGSTTVQEPPVDDAPDSAVEPDIAVEEEVFYRFTWQSKPRHTGPQKPKAKGKQKDTSRSRKPRAQDAKKNYKAKPEHGEKQRKIDPDNPFAAALMGFDVKK